MPPHSRWHISYIPYATFSKNESNFSKKSFEQMSHDVTLAIHTVSSFIINVNEDFGTDALSDLFSVFDDMIDE